MKIQKRLNVILVILLVVLVSIISFGGIYYKNKNEMSNRIPNYILGADLTGYRMVVLNPTNSSDSDSTDQNEVSNETNTEASNSTNTEASSNETGENSTNENTSSNETTENTNTPSNYIKTADILKDRLKTLGVENYTVKCNEDTGKIEINLPEDSRVDTILADIVETGKFKIIDADTDEVLIDNSDVRSVKLTEQTSYSTVYEVLNINFTTKGANKFKNITEKYQNTVSEDSTNTEVSNEENTETSNDVAENTTDESKSTSSKKVKISIDDSELLSTYFSEIVENGQLSLTLGSKSSLTEQQIYSAENLCAIIGNDPLPVEYKIDENTYIAPEIDENKMYAIIYIEIAIALLLALYLVIKYRIKGLMQTILLVGYVAILLIIIRVTNVYVSLSGIFAVLISFIISYVYSYMLLKSINGKDDLTKKEISRVLIKVSRKYCSILVPMLIISITSCLTKWVSLYSFGMILFWGIIISLIYNILISKFLIRSNVTEKSNSAS